MGYTDETKGTRSASISPAARSRAGAHTPPGVTKPKLAPRMGASGVHTNGLQNRGVGMDGKGEEPHGQIYIG